VKARLLREEFFDGAVPREGQRQQHWRGFSRPNLQTTKVKNLEKHYNILQYHTTHTFVPPAKSL
jgi:hypothetical protein